MEHNWRGRSTEPEQPVFQYLFQKVKDQGHRVFKSVKKRRTPRAFTSSVQVGGYQAP